MLVLSTFNTQPFIPLFHKLFIGSFQAIFRLFTLSIPPCLGWKFWFDLEARNLKLGVPRVMGLEGWKLPGKLQFWHQVSKLVQQHDSIYSVIYVMELEIILKQLVLGRFKCHLL